jgi:wobble nucleotide-excising tRNase
MQKLDHEITELRDVQKLSKYRSQIEKRIQLDKWIAKANQLVSSELNTKPITDLAKKAWKELISDSFKKQFEKEAEDLDAPKVSLEFHGEYGSQMRDKSLEGLDHVERFLSEGEQKAVALADFFAELWVHDKKIPVILDDPASSFDHDRKERIAKRIVKESDSKQVIVFTHDLMFAHFIHEQVENDKAELDNKKAAFHNLEKTGWVIGEVNANDYPGSRNFNYHIQKVEESVAHLNSLSGEEKREGIANAYSKLRSAVEKAVEEKIFGRVVTRWTDQIQLSRAPQATLNKTKLDEAKKLHEEFSRYIDAHNQSNEMIQSSMPDIDRLIADIKRVKNLAKSETD